MMITGIRNINFMLSNVQMFEVNTYSFSLAKSMTFPWLYKFTSMPFGYVCVQISKGQKLFYMYMFLPQMQHGLGITCSATVNNIVKI